MIIMVYLLIVNNNKVRFDNKCRKKQQKDINKGKPVNKIQRISNYD